MGSYVKAREPLLGPGELLSTTVNACPQMPWHLSGEVVNLHSASRRVLASPLSDGKTGDINRRIQQCSGKQCPLPWSEELPGSQGPDPD